MNASRGGKALDLSGSNITLINAGTIDPAYQSPATQLSGGVFIGSDFSSPGTVSVTNQATGIIRGTGQLPGLNLMSLDGMAISINNRIGGTTSITNSGTISSTDLSGLLMSRADTPVVAVYGGSAVNMTNSSTGSISGRVAFEASATGNAFTNAGEISGSVSLGEGSTNTFTSVTGSSISAGDGIQTGTGLGGLPGVGLTFAPTGQIDGGANGSNTLILQNSSGVVGDLSGDGDASSANYVNFNNLTINSGTWTLQGPLVSGATTLNGGLARFNNNSTFGTGVLTSNGGIIEASRSGLNLGNLVSLGAAGMTVQGAEDMTFSGVVSGSAGLIKNGTANLTLNGSNTWSGGTTLNAGTLTVGSDAALGSGALTVAGDATITNPLPRTLDNNINLNANLTIADSRALELGGVIAGSGTLTQNNRAILILSGKNTFNGLINVLVGGLNTVGSYALGDNASVNLAVGTSLSIGDSTSVGSLTGGGTVYIGDFDTLSIGGNNQSSTFDGVFRDGIDRGGLTKLGSGTVTLAGNSYLRSDTNINAGTLQINGSFASDNVLVNSGGTLAGNGRLRSAVTVADGGHLAATTRGTLSVGSLVLSRNSSFDVGLGAAVSGGGNALVSVGGNLTLDGTLNVSDIGGFGNGVYRVINYTGSLIDNGLLLGSVPGSVAPGDLQLQTNIGHQINLLVSVPGTTVQFWDGGQGGVDGSINGGNGTWASGTGNWTNVDGTLNLPWLDSFAVFQGTAGTVTVEGTQRFNGMQFVTDAYRLVAGNAGELSLFNGALGNATVRVDPNVTANLDVALNGSGTLGKYDSGTLVLNGNNAYTGGTALDGGTLVVGSNSALGTGLLMVNNGSGLDSNRAVTLDNAVSIAGNLAVGGSHDLILNGAIDGGGSLTKNGAANLILTGSNSLAGDTTVNAGTLKVDGSLASAQVQVNRGATLGGTGSLGGTVTVADGGHLALATGNTLSVNSLVLDANSNLDTRLGAPVAGGGSALLEVGGNLNLDGTLNISDAGGFGIGVYRLINYTGTLIDNGLSIGSTSGSAALNDLQLQTSIGNQLNLLVGAPGVDVQFWDGVQQVGNGAIDGGSGVWDSGNGNWTNVDGRSNQAWVSNFAVFQGTSGTVTVNGAQRMTGMQFASDGYQLVGGAAGQLTLVNGNLGNVSIRIDPNVSANLDVAINGTGTLGKYDSGTLVLNGNNSYTGGTALNGGKLVVGHNHALGTGALVAANGTTLDNNTPVNLANAVELNGRLTLAGSHDLTLSGVISGNGELNKQGASELTLSGNNNFTGSLNVLDGTLNLIDSAALSNADLNVASSALVRLNGFNNLDALSGSGALALAAGSSLQVGAGGASGVYDGSVNGAGHLSKIGTGKQVLDGNLTVGDGTTVAAGSLIIGAAAGSSASLASDVDVAQGAMLGGHGNIIGDVSLASGATLDPGNSIGTLKVDGDLSFNSGSTLVIEADPDGGSDQVAATGTVSLGGAGLSVMAGSGTWAPSTRYNIIQAGMLTGTFGSVSSNLAFLTPQVTYASNGVTLNLQRNDVAFTSVAQTYNQRAVAGALDAAGTGDVYDAVAVLSADQARSAYDSLSGEIHASTRGALFDDSRYVRDAVGSRLRSTQGQAPSEGVLHVDADSGMTFWVQGYGGWGDSDGNHNVADLDHNSQGMLLGIDMPLNDTWRAGLAAGYGNSDLDADARNSSARVDSTTLTAYLGGQWDALHLRAGVSHAWNEVDSSRHVEAGSLQEHVEADYDATTRQVFGELGYAVQAGDLTLEPFVGLAHVEVDSDSYREHGGSTALSGASEKERATYSSLGLRASTAATEVAGVPLSVQSSLAWQHVLDEPGENSRVTLAGYDSFTVKGIPVAQDTALVQLGVSARLAPQASLDLGYSGQIGDGYSDHGVRLGLNIAF